MRMTSSVQDAVRAAMYAGEDLVKVDGAWCAIWRGEPAFGEDPRDWCGRILAQVDPDGKVWWHGYHSSRKRRELMDALKAEIAGVAL